MSTLRAKLIGVWQLSHYETWRVDGDVVPPKGWGSEPPKTSVSYHLDGRMWVQHMGLQQPLFAAGYIADTLDKRFVASPHNVLAYRGTWEVNEAAETVTHHVELDKIPTWKNSAQVCNIFYSNFSLKLVGPEISVFGEIRTPHFVLVRERAMPENG